MELHISELERHNVDMNIHVNTHFIKIAGKFVFETIVPYTVFCSLCILWG